MVCGPPSHYVGYRDTVQSRGVYRRPCCLPHSVVELLKQHAGNVLSQTRAVREKDFGANQPRRLLIDNSLPLEPTPVAACHGEGALSTSNACVYPRHDG